jgi:signal peptidase II
MIALLVAVALVLLDQVTKVIIRQQFDVGGSLAVVPGFFNLCYVRNTGAAWGMFRGGNAWLALLSVGFLIAMIVWRHHFFPRGRWGAARCGLLSGGIVGNLIDRVRLEYVVDFLDFHLGTHHFPAFNVADSAICISVALYMVWQYVVARRETADKGATGVADTMNDGGDSMAQGHELG